MTDPRKRVKFGLGSFQFRAFTDVVNPEERAIKSQLHHAAKHSKADSLLRKFSWEKDQ